MKCPTCHAHVHPTTSTTPHLFWLVATLLSCGLALPMWMGSALGAGLARSCPACGVAL